MNKNELYNAWKDRRSQIEIRKDFSEKAMNQIYQYEQKRDRSSFGSMRLVDLISAHPLAKVALIVSGALAGLIRLAIMIVAILNGGIASG